MVFTVQCYPTKSDIHALGCKLGCDSPFTFPAKIKTKLIKSLALHPQYNVGGSEANYLASANNEFI